MGGTNRGHFTISANISMTASLISRTFSLGFVLLCLYIKVGDNIINEDVIRVAHISDVAGMPLGMAVKCVMFSLIGVFTLDLTTGVVGILGSVGKRKTFLKVNVLMSLLMIIIYIVYIVILSIIYGKKSDFLDEISNYSSVFSGAYYDNVYGDWHNYVSDNFRNITRLNFFSQLGCDINTDTLDSCLVVFDEQLSTYLETYLGLITVCLICQVATIFAAEYTHRKFELKDQRLCISHTKYYLLLTLKLGVFPDIFMSVKQCWIQSKAKIISIAFKVFSIIAGCGLLGLGLAIVGDKFITNSSLQYIFYRIQFHQYYLYDILVCLGASSVIIGLLTIAIQIVGFAGSWRKSSSLLILSVISSSVLLVPRIISVVIIAALIKSINNTLQSKLYLQEQGYYFQDAKNVITKHWNVMLLVLNCCGIWNSSDTINSTYGKIFCCNNARDFLLNPDESYSEYVIVSGNRIHSYDDLEKFGGCGDYKTQTCGVQILDKIKLFVGLFLGIVFLQITLEVIGVFLVNKEHQLFSPRKGCDQNTEYKKNICATIVYKLKTSAFSELRRSRSSISYAIALLVITIANIALLGPAIGIQYDEIFGNINIKVLLASVNISGSNLNEVGHNFTAVVSFFSTVSIIAVACSIIILTSGKVSKWRLYSISGLWSILCISSIIEIGLWGRIHSVVSNVKRLRVGPALEHQLSDMITTYKYSSESGNYTRDPSLNWNTLFVKAKCCGIGSNIQQSISTTLWYNSFNRTTKIGTSTHTSTRSTDSTILVTSTTFEYSSTDTSGESTDSTFPTASTTLRYSSSDTSIESSTVSGTSTPLGYSSIDLTGSPNIPVQCCKSESLVYPFGKRYNDLCTVSLNEGSYHSVGCDVAIKNRLDSYSIPFFFFMGLNIIAEIICVGTTVFNFFHRKTIALQKDSISSTVSQLMNQENTLVTISMQRSEHIILQEVVDVDVKAGYQQIRNNTKSRKKNSSKQKKRKKHHRAKNRKEDSIISNALEKADDMSAKETPTNVSEIKNNLVGVEKDLLEASDKQNIRFDVS